MTDTSIEPTMDSDLLSMINPYAEDSNEKERLTHIVNPPNNIHLWQPGMTAKELVEIARFTEQKLVALCGIEWIPRFNPENYDVCKECLDAAEVLMRS